MHFDLSQMTKLKYTFAAIANDLLEYNSAKLVLMLQIQFSRLTRNELAIAQNTVGYSVY